MREFGIHIVTTGFDSMADRYYNLPRIWRELRETIFFERGFFFTAWRILTTPGQALQQILDGGSHRFQDPVKFLFLCVALAALIMNLDVTRRAMSGGFDFPQQAPEPKFQLIQQQLAEVLADPEINRDIRFRAVRAQHELEYSMPNWASEETMKWMNVMLLVAVPFYAVGTWLLFRRDLNLAEHLVVNGYVYGVQCLISIVVLPVYFWSMTGASLAYFVVSSIYQFFAWHQTFRLTGWFDFLKCVVLQFGVTFVYLIAVIAVMVVVVLVMLVAQMQSF